MSQLTVSNECTSFEQCRPQKWPVLEMRVVSQCSVLDVKGPYAG